MGDEVKKISFGFSKLVKKTNIVSSQLNQVKPEETKVEFIDCLEGKSIKLKDPTRSETNVLVIPIKRQLENVSKVEKDHLSNEQSTVSKKDSLDCSSAESPANKLDCVLNVKNEQGDDLSTTDSNNTLSFNPSKCEPLTLDEIAAKEILEDLNKNKAAEETNIFSVPLTSNAPVGEKESTLDDYESIPVGDFGLAMLRGMGWAPGKGIGKNEKLITPSLPTVRPKGMGLGADKVIQAAIDNKSVNEDLKMEKGSFIRVIAGPLKDLYGQIEGFDDESGRLIIKLALKSGSISLNEFMVQLVDKKEFIKNSKVINVGKYEQYKEDEGKSPNQIKSLQTVKKEKIQRKSDSLVNKTFEKNLNKSEISKYKETLSPCGSELLDTKNIAIKEEKHMPLSPFRTTSSKIISTSSSRSPEDNYRSRCSKSPPKSSLSHSRTDTSKKKHEKSSHKESSTSKRSIRHRSSSTERNSSSSDHSRRHKNRTRKKKPSSHKQKSRSRSRSPRRHSTHKKHKKSKYK